MPIGLPGACCSLSYVVVHTPWPTIREVGLRPRGYEDTLFKFPQMLHARAARARARCTVLINII